ncbi:MAG: ABC transporter permease [Candidatus Krumholzibacteria bacterium]|nr:ABC transporter permease [Candidatus Krumholzibacteria bacterium]
MNDRQSIPGTPPRGLWSAGWVRFKRNRLGMTGAIIIVILYVTAVLAPLLTPYDPIEHGDIPRMRYVSPGSDHLLGTDKFGRDILTRMLYGSRISLTISFLAVAISVVLGSLVGATAGYFGGVVDAIIMRIVDALMAIPRLFLLLTCIALFSGSLWLIIALLGATGWMATARLVRGQVLALSGRDFVKAAEVLGAGSRRIVLRHLLPNTLTVIIVAATLRIGGIILTEAALSFLGLGVPPPTPSWGQMIFHGREVLLSAWWVSTFPGMAIVVTVIGYNLLGDGLRDAFDPRQFT